MVPTTIAISIVAFAIIQAPPGDYLATMVARLEAEGEQVDRSQLDALEERYGLDQPFYVQYWRWISGIVFRLDFGQSFEWNRPVADLIAEALPLTVVLSRSEERRVGNECRSRWSEVDGQ